MHIEIDKDNKRIVLTFVGTNEKEIYEKMENIKATLETKYDGETKVILRSRLYVEGDEKDQVGTRSFVIDFNESLANALSYNTWFDHASEVLKEEDISIGYKPYFSPQEEIVMRIVPFRNISETFDKLDYYLPREFQKHHVEHGRRFQRLRQKQWFKK